MASNKMRSPPAYDLIQRFFTTLPQAPRACIPPKATLARVRNVLGARLSTATAGRQASSWGGIGGGASKERLAMYGSSKPPPWTRAYSTSPPQPPNSPPTTNGASSPASVDDGDLHPGVPALRPNKALSTRNPHPTYLASLPRSLRRLAAALPAPAGRPPSRDQLLALTTSFFERLRIRFKWATIRSYRRFRADDYSAFFSFGILGTLGWFLLSTTSFFAFAFFLVNSLSSQEWLAKKLGDYMTAHTGVTVVFENAIVPKWGLAGGGSKIVFKNVYISRGPSKGELGVLPANLGEEREETEEEREWREAMAKWTHFHLSIDTVEVSLSLRRWLDGKGLVKDASVTGVRGVVERSHITYDPEAPRDRFAYRHHAQPGDFWLENLQIEDFLVTIYQPDHFRPYTFSIFNADIRRLRKQWLFYDLMSADSITGQVDNCLFSLHKPQSIGRTSEEDLKDVRWARMSRFRIDGVPVDHMQSAHDTGVMSWVTSGRCDLVADIRFPRDESDVDLSTIVADIVDQVGNHLGQQGKNSSKHEAEEAEFARKGVRIPGRQSLTKSALEAPKGWKVLDDMEEQVEKERLARATSYALAKEGADAHEADGDREKEIEDRRVSIDLDIRFKDLKASVPFFTSDLSYVNNALIRPIVAFINSNRTLIPIHCHIDLALSEFNGSWTTYDVGLLDRMSEQTYAALAHHVQNANHQRLQAVSLWTLQMTASGVLSAFKNNLGAPF